MPILPLSVLLGLCGGDLSIGSSIRLKSPSTKSGFGSLLWRLVCSIFFQKSRWVHLSFGAYMLSMGLHNSSLVGSHAMAHDSADVRLSRDLGSRDSLVRYLITSLWALILV